MLCRVRMVKDEERKMYSALVQRRHEESCHEGMLRKRVWLEKQCEGSQTTD
jgi:hypothetical protein